MSRRAGLRRGMRHSPDYAVSAEITTLHGGVVADVPCRVYLPRTVSGRSYLEFDLSETHRGSLTVPEFSMKGRVETPSGMVSVRSDIVITQGWSAEYQASKFRGCTLPGEPWDLEITKRTAATDDDVLQNGTFWLTPNRFLNPSLQSLFSHTGEVKIETARELSFQLSTTLIRFRRYFHHDRTKQGLLTTSELVAEFNENVDLAHLKSIVEELDDLLLLTSLATRHRCVCRGWILRTEHGETRFYRSSLAVPKPREIEAQETLIDDSEFADFLKHSLSSFRHNNGREALRQAIDLVVSSQDGTIEASFLTGC
jgi:hypothetical protein